MGHVLALADETTSQVGQAADATLRRCTNASAERTASARTAILVSRGARAEDGDGGACMGKAKHAVLG